MAAPVCSRETLFETNPGFGLAGLDENQYTAAMVYILAANLAALGGTNYLSAMTTTLVTDATSFIGGVSPDQFRIAMLNIARNKAVAAGASIPTDLSTLNEQTGCCLQASPLLPAMLLMLTCQLGRYAAYPQ